MSDKKTTDRQLAANRANARKSTGPRTPKGKAHVCGNAIKHGLFARDLVLPEGHGESIDEFNALRDQLRDDLAPANAMEELVVERLAATYWRARRACRYEAQTILKQRQHDATPISQMVRDLQGISTSPTEQLPAGNDFDRLLRYEGMIDRTLHRLALQLTRLQRPQVRNRFTPPDSAGADSGDEQ